MGIMSYQDSSTGRSESVVGYNGHVPVTTLPGGTAHIRESITLTTTPENFDFSATPIKAATVYLYPAVDTLTAAQNSAVICIDPPNQAVATSWLTAADSLAADSQRIPVVFGYPIELSFTSPIDYIWAKVDDAGTTAELRMIIVGVEA